MIAIVPAAGKGTRMAEVTGGLPKELLQVGGKSVLQWVLEEGLAAGVTAALVVTSPDKPEIAAALGGVGVLIQESATGLGPAVALAPVGPALVLLPDTIYYPASPAARIAKEIAGGRDIVIAVEQVDESRVHGYGIIEWDTLSGRIHRIAEKPAPGVTRSRWAIAARFGLSAKTMDFLKQTCSGSTSASRHISSRAKGDPAPVALEADEIGLTVLLNQAIRAGHSAIAVALEPGEQRLDCGTPEGYLHALQVVGEGI